MTAKNHSDKEKYKDFPIGGGDYIRQYEAVNPIQEMFGGKIKLIRKRRD